ncbi:MAG: BatD family protein [Bacteroidales bacterium]
MKRFIFIAIICILGPGSISAQDVSFTAKAKTVVEEGQNFYLQYQMNKKGRNLKLPDMDNFQVLSGPTQQTSSSTRIVNNNVTHTHTFTYTWVVKAPESGSYTIPPATVSIEGQEYKSNSLTINVIESGQAGSSQQQAGGQRQSTQSGSSTGSEDPFARLTVNKNSAWEEEPIYASLKLYLPERNLAGFEDISFPEFNGFWAEDYKMPEQIHLERGSYNGKAYYIAELASWILYPQRSGNLSISQGELELVMREQVQGGGNSRSLFDSFFSQYENVRKTIPIPGVNMDIRGLPSGKPAGFNGGVGTFNVETSLSHDSIDVNDAFNLRIKISGKGNLNLLSEPNINLPEIFEVYDPEVKSNYSQSIQGSTGSIEYNYTIIPRYPDTHTLPEIKLAWFDPAAEEYKTYSSGNYKIDVRRTADYEDSTPQARGTGRSDVREIATDIRFLKETDKKSSKIPDFFNTTVFWMFYLLPFALLGIIVLLRRKQIKARQDVARLRNKKANKVAMRRLKKAKSLMQSDDKEFYNETIKALWGYIADKLDMDTANLSRDSVTDKLRERDIPENLIEKLRTIIDKCEYAHFAPDSAETEPQRIYKYAVTLITKLEQNL